MVLQRPLYHRLHLAQVKGLHQIVEGAEAERFNGALHSLHPTDHHDHRIWREALHLRQHLESAHPRHRDIADHQLKLALVQALQRLFRGARFRALMPVAKQIGQDFGYLSLVVNDENARTLITWHVLNSYNLQDGTATINQIAGKSNTLL